MLSVHKYIFYQSCNAALWFKLGHQAVYLSTCQILLKKTSMMQFCSTRQFISCSQTLILPQPAAAVLPADAAEPLTSTFTKVMESASASTWLPSQEEPGQAEQQSSSLAAWLPGCLGTPADCTFNHHRQPRAPRRVRTPFV